MKNLCNSKFEKSRLHLLEQVKETEFAIPDNSIDYLPYADTLSASSFSLESISKTSHICGALAGHDQCLERAFNEIMSVPTLRDLSFVQSSERRASVGSHTSEGRSVSQAQAEEEASVRRVAKHWASQSDDEEPDDAMIRLAARLKHGRAVEAFSAPSDTVEIADIQAVCRHPKRNDVPGASGACIGRMGVSNHKPLPLPKPPLACPKPPMPLPVPHRPLPNVSAYDDQEMPTRAFVVRSSPQSSKGEKAGDGQKGQDGLSDLLTPLCASAQGVLSKPCVHGEKASVLGDALALDNERKGKIKGLDSSEVPIGHVVAHRYEILSEIARGGYGVVYRARQIGLDRIVALKRLKDQNNADMVKRFLREADIIKNLIHPNTIQLIDAGNDHDNHLYIVMEYIEGRSLQTILNRQEHVDVQRAIHITLQILKSLNEAHQRGIIHRDLKPSNILLREVIGEPDFVKVLDFGIAKQTHSGISKLTQAGTVLGTPQYIAPELFVGTPPSAASDIYAIGLILAHMVIGHSLVPSGMMEAINWHYSTNEVVLPPRLMRVGIGRIICKAIRKNPAERYQNVMEMMYALQELMHPNAGKSLMKGFGIRLMKRSGRSFRMYLISILMTLIVVLVGVLLFV